MNRHVPPSRRQMQVYPRMRAPGEARPFALQFHVVQAIRHCQEIPTGESAYQDALGELLNGSTAGVLNDLNAWAKGIVSKEIQGKEQEAGLKIMDKVHHLALFDEDYPSVAKFNREFLNNSDGWTLIYSLVIDAADLDLIALDKYRGGAGLEAAYGPRRTQAAKREGKRLQALLKKLASFDEPAMMAAADQYVVYRHVHGGSFPDYKRREELQGSSFSERHAREWFHDFDNALGYPLPKPGRPRKRPYPTKPPQDKAPQRKVHRSKGHRRR